MTDILESLALLSVLVFVIGSMLSMGLSLTTKQIIEPLRNTRLVVLALVANFVVVPIAAYVITLVLPLDESISIGLILVSTAAGAPFLPKLVEVAKGNTAFSVGLMVLQMVVTIVFLPIVLPLLIQGVEVNPLDIAQSLVVMMLIPLAIGLFIKARYEESAEKIRPTFASASNLAILVLIVLGVVLNFDAMIGLVGSFGILAAILLVAIALATGYLLGGSDPSIKSVMALGTGQRNISAALVVAAQNFDADVITYLAVFSVVGFVLLFPAAGELGKRS
ncbi:MAG: bile acid:sodium symporter family protein [Chloroflexi bacterium]|nr:MAG: bile acid:sodium symporter family protein [Chloroflexota bacterium]